MLILAGITVLVNAATGLAASGTSESLLHPTLIPAGMLTISPRLETDPANISDRTTLNRADETHPVRSE